MHESELEVVTMTVSQACIHGRGMFPELVLPGIYDAKLVGLRNARGHPCEVTKRFVFRITRGECKNIKLCYFAAVNGQDQNFHLKLVLHFLGCRFDSVDDVDLKGVEKRRCQIKVRHRERNGRVFPEIYGFAYSSDCLCGKGW